MNRAVCEVVPGPGSVARRGDSLMWAADQTSDVLWNTLLSCLALGDRATGAGPLLHAVAETMLGDLNPDAAFVVVLTDGAAGFVLRQGRVDVTLDGESLRGGAVVAVGVTGRAVAAGDRGALQALTDRTPSSRHDLRDGAVAGGGFRWSAPTGAPVGTSEQPSGSHDMPVAAGTPSAAAGAPSADSDEKPADDSDGAAPAAAVGASPPDGAPGAPPAPNYLGGPAIDITDVQGEVTSDPEQTELHPAPSQDSASSPALRRSGGVLVFEDGATAALTGDVVLGRRPERHELVESGRAQPIVIHDPENVLSSAHAAVHLQGDEVVVVDLESLNGTHIAAPDARDWTKLTAGAPYPMHDGYRMLLGWTVLTYRTSSA